MNDHHALAEHMTQDREDRIESSAKASYNFKTYLKNDDIRVESSGGEVVLEGTVSEDFHRYLAQETVSGLPGVKSVSNRLVVIGEQPGEKSDAWISLKVKAVLAFHKNVSGSETEVRTQNGVVTLTGGVASEAQKQLTGEYAKDVEGVTVVLNDLIVSPSDDPRLETLGQKAEDASITAQIKTSLLFHYSTHAMTTNVVTKDGVVTLSGKAMSEAEKDLATKLAEDIRDVKLVSNQMIVQGP